MKCNRSNKNWKNKQNFKKLLLLETNLVMSCHEIEYIKNMDIMTGKNLSSIWVANMDFIYWSVHSVGGEGTRFLN